MLWSARLPTCQPVGGTCPTTWLTPGSCSRGQMRRQFGIGDGVLSLVNIRAWVSKLWLHLSWGSRVFLKIASACWVVCFDNRPRLGMSVMSCKLWSCPKRPFDPLHRRKAAMFFSLQWLGAQQSHPSLTGFSAESLRRQDVYFFRAI